MATKNIVPRAANEGQLGTTAKPWAKVVTAGLDIVGGFAKSPSIELEFMNAVASISPLTTGAIASGTSLAGTAVETANHPGVVGLVSSTSPNSGYFFGAGSNLNHYFFSGGEEFTCIFEVDVTTNTTVRLGYSDSNTATAPNDGVFLQIIGTTLTGVARNNDSETDTLDTPTITQGVWYRARIVLNANASLATFTLFTCADGQPVAWVRNTVATNIPTTAGRGTGANIMAFTSDTAAAKSLASIDYARWDFNRVLVR